MSKIILAIKQFDFLSQKPTLLINNSDRAKSVYGAFLTFLIAIISILFAIVCLLKLFYRYDPILSIHEEVDKHDDLIDVVNFPLFFMIKKENYSINIDFDINARMYNNILNINEQGYNSGHTNYKNINYEKCDMQGKNNTIDISLRNFFCLKPEDKLSRSIHHNNENFITLSINHKCNQSCEMKGYEFIFGYFDPLLDIHDSKFPSSIISIPKIISHKLIYGVNYDLELNLMKGTYNTDFGYIFTDIYPIEFIFIEKDAKISTNTNNFINVKIVANNYTRTVYMRKFYKAQMFFAELGGIFNFLFIIGYNINLLHSIINLNLTIDRECKISFYSEREMDTKKNSLRFSMLKKNSQNFVRKSEVAINTHLDLKERNSPEHNVKNNLTMLRDNRRQFDVINLNNIGIRKINFNLDTLENSMTDFRKKIKSLSKKNPAFYEIFLSMVCCCYKDSKKIKVYNKTSFKIREYLDINNLIRLFTEFQFIKNVLLSKTALELFNGFTDIKALNNEKINEIHFLLKKLHDNIHNVSSETEEITKESDIYMAEFFIENIMKH